MENDLIFLNMNEKDENLEIRRFVGCCHYMSSHGSENRKLSPFLVCSSALSRGMISLGISYSVM